MNAFRLISDSLKRFLSQVLFLGMPEELKSCWKVRFVGAPDMAWSLRELKKKGFFPKRIVDCGAHVGNWTKMVKEIFPNAYVLMVEAQPGSEESLKQVKSIYPSTVDYEITLLGAQNRTSVQFYQTGNQFFGSTGSSVLEEQSNVPRQMLTLPMKTLDEVIITKQLKEVSLLKLDVQGYELETLKGATNTLKSVQVVLMEVSLVPYNKGAPLLHEVVRFMNECGFLAYDICSLIRHGKDGTLVQLDMIFVRQESIWRPSFFEY